MEENMINSNINNSFYIPNSLTGENSINESFFESTLSYKDILNQQNIDNNVGQYEKIEIGDFVNKSEELRNTEFKDNIIYTKYAELKISNVRKPRYYVPKSETFEMNCKVLNGKVSSIEDNRFIALFDDQDINTKIKMEFDFNDLESDDEAKRIQVGSVVFFVTGYQKDFVFSNGYYRELRRRRFSRIQVKEEIRISNYNKKKIDKKVSEWQEIFSKMN